MLDALFSSRCPSLAYLAAVRCERLNATELITAQRSKEVEEYHRRRRNDGKHGVAQVNMEARHTVERNQLLDNHATISRQIAPAAHIWADRYRHCNRFRFALLRSSSVCCYVLCYELYERCSSSGCQWSSNSYVSTPYKP